MRYISIVLVIAMLLSVPALAASPDPAAPSVPVEESTVFESELLTILGNIQAYLIFFVLVILLYFVYKFFRIFF